MYEKLVNLLRRCGKQKCKDCEYEYVIGCVTKMNEDAADAIEAQDRHILTLQHEMMAEAESHIALVERLSKQNKKLEEAVKTALDFIPCWIPVTERLPEKDTRVIVCASLPEGVHSDFIYEDGHWFVSIGVTHWMPLPEPPKEG